MTLPPDPTLFLAHCKAHKSQPCKELKIPTHCPPTPADGILIGLTSILQPITTFSRHLRILQDTLHNRKTNI